MKDRIYPDAELLSENGIFQKEKPKSTNASSGLGILPPQAPQNENAAQPALTAQQRLLPDVKLDFSPQQPKKDKTPH